MLFNWVIIGGSAIIALLYTFAIYYRVILERTRVKSLLKKRASAEHAEFLLANVTFDGRTDMRSHLPLVAPALTILSNIMVEVLTKGFMTHMFAWLMLFSGMCLGYLVMKAIAILTDIAEDEGVEWRRTELRVSHFLSRREIWFLVRTGGKQAMEEHWDNIGSSVVHAPDALISLLNRKEELQAYDAVEEGIEKAINNRKDYLTPEQQEQNARLKQDYLQSIRQFEPLLQDLIASTRVGNSNQVKQEQVQTRERVAVALKTAEQKLQALKIGGVSHPDTTTQQADVAESIRDLTGIIQSENVTAALKAEAHDLMEKIIQKKAGENNRKDERVKQDALAIIQANRLHFGIPE